MPKNKYFTDRDVFRRAAGNVEWIIKKSLSCYDQNPLTTGVKYDRRNVSDLAGLLIDLTGVPENQKDAYFEAEIKKIFRAFDTPSKDDPTKSDPELIRPYIQRMFSSIETDLNKIDYKDVNQVTKLLLTMRSSQMLATMVSDFPEECSKFFPGAKAKEMLDAIGILGYMTYMEGRVRISEQGMDDEIPDTLSIGAGLHKSSNMLLVSQINNEVGKAKIEDRDYILFDPTSSELFSHYFLGETFVNNDVSGVEEMPTIIEYTEQDCIKSFPELLGKGYENTSFEHMLLSRLINDNDDPDKLDPNELVLIDGKSMKDIIAEQEALLGENGNEFEKLEKAKLEAGKIFRNALLDGVSKVTLLSATMEVNGEMNVTERDIKVDLDKLNEAARIKEHSWFRRVLHTLGWKIPPKYPSNEQRDENLAAKAEEPKSTHNKGVEAMKRRIVQKFNALKRPFTDKRNIVDLVPKANLAENRPQIRRNALADLHPTPESLSFTNEFVANGPQEVMSFRREQINIPQEHIDGNAPLNRNSDNNNVNEQRNVIGEEPYNIIADDGRNQPYNIILDDKASEQADIISENSSEQSYIISDNESEESGNLLIEETKTNKPVNFPSSNNNVVAEKPAEAENGTLADLYPVPESISFTSEFVADGPQEVMSFRRGRVNNNLNKEQPKQPEQPKQETTKQESLGDLYPIPEGISTENNFVADGPQEVMSFYRDKVNAPKENINDKVPENNNPVNNNVNEQRNVIGEEPYNIIADDDRSEHNIIEDDNRSEHNIIEDDDRSEHNINADNVADNVNEESGDLLIDEAVNSSANNDNILVEDPPKEEVPDQENVNSLNRSKAQELFSDPNVKEELRAEFVNLMNKSTSTTGFKNMVSDQILQYAELEVNSMWNVLNEKDPAELEKRMGRAAVDFFDTTYARLFSLNLKPEDRLATAQKITDIMINRYTPVAYDEKFAKYGDAYFLKNTGVKRIMEKVDVKNVEAAKRIYNAALNDVGAGNDKSEVIAENNNKNSRNSVDQKEKNKDGVEKDSDQVKAQKRVDDPKVKSKILARIAKLTKGSPTPNFMKQVQGVLTYQNVAGEAIKMWDALNSKDPAVVERNIAQYSKDLFTSAYFSLSTFQLETTDRVSTAQIIADMAINHFSPVAFDKKFEKYGDGFFLTKNADLDTFKSLVNIDDYTTAHAQLNESLEKFRSNREPLDLSDEFLLEEEINENSSKIENLISKSLDALKK